MTSPVKVHPGLKVAHRHKTYHLGHYTIEFEDRQETFQLHANLCDEPACLCDNLQMTLLVGDVSFRAWYSSGRDWTDKHGRAIPEVVATLFETIEETETFFERYSHLMYLRRKQVLAEVNRLGDPFEVLLPKELAEMIDEGIAGYVSIVSDGKSSVQCFSLDLCADPECFCRELFLILPEMPGPLAFLIGENDRWQPTEENDASIAIMNQVREKLTASPKFNTLVVALRQERRLQNYHRFVRGYSEKTGITV